MLLIFIVDLISQLAFTLLACPKWWRDICYSAFNPWELLIFRYHFELGRIFLTVEHVATDLDILAAEMLSLILVLNVSIMHIFNLCNLPI